MRRTESHFSGADGRTLFRRGWVPDRVDRVLLLVHGLGEHSGRYEEFGSWFARHDVAVHAYDQQGHGRSIGRRGHASHFHHFVDDLEIVLKSVSQEHQGPPIFLLGHSMGGLVVARLLRERKTSLAGAICASGALALNPEVSKSRIWVLRLMRMLLPRWRLAIGIESEALSNDPAVGREYMEDPLVLKQMTVGLAAEIFTAIQLAEVGTAEIQTPMLLLHGEDDAMCPVEGSRAFCQGMEAPSELRTYPGLRHEILNEPTREAIFEDILSWLCRRAHEDAQGF